MRVFLLIAVIGGALFWFLSRPDLYLPFEIPKGDQERGAYVAIAAGCASCHGEDYAGGEALYSPFGTFYAPNITPATYQASAEEFARGLLNGVGQDGQHLYPAFPYSSYQNMTSQDVGDLYAYVSVLPEIEQASRPHDLPFFARWRRALGIWKLMRSQPPWPDTRGGYLVEVLGHCQECHTPRMPWGTLRYSRAFEGGNIYGPKGKMGKTPNLITGDSANWTASELSSYFTDGFTPDFDSVGGEMVEVVDHLAQLSDADRDAIAVYIESLHQSSP